MADPVYVFDTGALIDIYHGRSRIIPYFGGLFTRPVPAYLSVVSEAELWRGMRPGEVELHEALLSRFVVLPIVTAVARRAGEWMQLYGPQGLGWMDAFIAATGQAADATVLTRDKRLAALLGDVVAFEVY